ncbi:isoamyl alcohol oxidase [Paramyrothecium foliicola]|nr:isoamyl alcohol oxidase [Paramyrothecium foliicola]
MIINTSNDIISVIDWEDAWVVAWEIVEFAKDVCHVPPLMDGPLYRETEIRLRNAIERKEYVEMVSRAEEARGPDNILSTILADFNIQQLAHAIWLYQVDGRFFKVKLPKTKLRHWEAMAGTLKISVLWLFLGKSLVHASSYSPPILAVPSEAWDTLNSSLSGRLQVGRPAALPCFSRLQDSSGFHENPDANQQQCQEVHDGISTSANLVREFGSYHNPTFSTCMAIDRQCTLSASRAANVTDGVCHQGTVPDFYINAQEVEDIQLGLKFAKEHKIPVTIKNTGHDYKGRSTGPNTLAIWTKNIVPELDIDEDYTPEGCEVSAGPAVTYGAGQTSRDLYQKLDGTGYFAVGGSCTTVGVAGGWLAGGGHSIVTPTLGLGVDNALQLKVVLPNGTYVTANRCQNQDLFFALRGGGGGTYGVVFEATSKLHKDRQFVYAFLSGNVLTQKRREINEVLAANAERWADEGWGGLYGVDDNAGTVFLAFNPNQNLEEAKNSLKPLHDYLAAESPESTPPIVSITTLPSHWAAQNAPELLAFLASEAGISMTRSSRLVPRKNFQSPEGQKELVDVLAAKGWASVLGTPTAFKLPESDLPGGPGEASVTPAWRNALWHFTYTAVWDQGDPVATRPDALVDIFTKISKDMDPMRAITPGGGAYQSEGDVYEPESVQSFWGQQNYDRLLKIKKELDPDNLLSCFTCVGWERSNPRHHCYPSVRTQDPNLASVPLMDSFFDHVVEDAAL